MALYSDFDLSFEPDPVSRDLKRVEDDASVRQAVKNVILTSLYERVFQPELGSEIYRSLFEPLDQVTTTILARSIADAVRLFEPRAKLQFLDVHFDKMPTGERIPEHSVYIEVVVQVFNLPNPITTGVLLRRLR
jgi:uncharacterized protein